jgi:hypothetical protein
MSSPPERTPLSSDDLQVVDNVLRDTDVPSHTRRSLLGKAALGVAAASAIPVGVGLAQGGGSSPKEIGTTAVTAEALAVTFLTNAIQSVGSSFPANVQAVLKAANQAEYDHYQYLRGAGFKPLTTRFWVPDALLAPSELPAAIELAETVFINAYLVAIQAFAKAGQAETARVAGQILGVEAEHRTLARFVQGKLPNNLGFEVFAFQGIDQAVKALQGAGIGFGSRTSKPGRFYTFPGQPPAGTTLPLVNDTPDDVKSLATAVGAVSGQPSMTG